MTHANDFAAGCFAGGDGLGAATEVALLRGAAGDADAGAGPWVGLGAVLDMEAVAGTGAERAPRIRSSVALQCSPITFWYYQSYDQQLLFR